MTGSSVVVVVTEEHAEHYWFFFFSTDFVFPQQAQMTGSSVVVVVTEEHAEHYWFLFFLVLIFIFFVFSSIGPNDWLLGGRSGDGGARRTLRAAAEAAANLL
jgi:hypothetical protein